jgi:hypothetical protein
MHSHSGGPLGTILTIHSWDLYALTRLRSVLCWFSIHVARTVGSSDSLPWTIHSCRSSGCTAVHSHMAFCPLGWTPTDSGIRSVQKSTPVVVPVTTGLSFRSMFGKLDSGLLPLKLWLSVCTSSCCGIQVEPTPVIQETLGPETPPLLHIMDAGDSSVHW